jgi:hypothetical protein
MRDKPPYPGIRVTANGNQLVSYYTETRIADAGIFIPLRHRSYVQDFGVFIKVVGPNGIEYRTISRQLVLFCVERRKAWRMLQSKAGIENKEYKAQRSLLADVDAGKISKEEFFARADELLKERVKGSGAPAPHKMPVPAPAPAAQRPHPESAPGSMG